MSVERVTESKSQSPSLLRSIYLVSASVIISGSLYHLTRPTLAPYLVDVNRPIDQIPWPFIIASRAIEILGYAYAGYTQSRDVIFLSCFARTTYLALLHISFDVPILVLAISLFIDTFALWMPLQLLVEPSTGGGAKERIDIKKEWTLTVVLTLIASSLFSMTLYVAQKTTLPTFLMGHFDGVVNIQASPLPLLLLGFLPAGYCLQEIIYTHGFHHGSIALLVAQFLVSSSKIGLGVRGGDLFGIFGTTQFGNAIAAFTTIVIGYILKV